MVVVPEGGLGPAPLPSLLFSVDAALWWFLSLTHGRMLRAETRAERTDGGSAAQPARGRDPRTAPAAARPARALRALGPEEGLFHSNQCLEHGEASFCAPLLIPHTPLVSVSLDFVWFPREALAFIFFALIAFQPLSP